MKINQLSEWTLSFSIKEYFCCDWSEDDKVFIINTDGIDVHHFKPNPKNKQNVPEFERSFIFPAINHPTNNSGFEDNFVLFLSKLDLQKVLSDPLITPNFNFNPKFPATIKKAAWSCADVLPTKNCLLAVSTTLGYVSIWIYHANWSPLLDISHLVYLHLKNNNLLLEISKDLEDSVEIATYNCRQLSSTAMAWCNDIYTDTNQNNYSFFITAQKNGSIYIWTLRFEETVDQTISNASLDFEYSSNIVDINEVRWISLSKTNIIIVIGTVKGLIFVLQITKENDNLKFVKVSQVWEDEDDLAVSKISSVKWDENSYYVFVVKRTFLISFLVDEHCNSTNLDYKDFGNLNITSLQFLNDKKFCLSMLTGVLFVVEIVKNEDVPGLKSSMIKSDLNFNKFAQHGLCLSRNKVIWLNILTPCRRVKKYHGKNWSQCVVAYIDDFNPLLMLQQNKTQVLTTHWDILELLRVLKLKKQFVCNEEVNSLMKIENCKTLYEIKLCFWLNFICKESLEAEDITKDVSREILIHHARIYLKRIVEKYKETNLLSQSDLEAIGLQFKLTKSFDYQDFVDLSAIADSQPQVVKHCEWCDEELLYPICSKYHQRQFCCITFRDVDSKCFLSCYLCGAVAHIDLKYSNPLCTFCDSTMKYLPLCGDRRDDQLFKVENSETLIKIENHEMDQ